MILILGKDCELAIGTQDFGSEWVDPADPNRAKTVRMSDLVPYIGIKLKPVKANNDLCISALLDDIEVILTKKQAMQIRKAIDRVWSDNVLI